MSLACRADEPIEAFLHDVKARVDAHLTSFFEEKRESARALSAPSAELVEAVHDFTMRGGKRTRPAILLAGHLAIAPLGELGPLLDACAGLELLQSYLLIHDDWMDQDDERRGGTTLHRLFSDRLQNRHLGASIAVLAGDLGNAFALELVGRSAARSRSVEAALEVFWTMQRDVVYGQGLDLLAYRDVALIQRLKTGSYSVKGPLLLGAVLAGASAAQQRALTGFADPVGEIFQLRDDLLGTFGNPEKTGKPAGNDLRAGKRTALVEEAEQRLSEREREPLRAVLGRADASEAALAAAIELLERSGIRAAVEARIERLDRDARGALHEADLTETGRRLLTQLAYAFAHRDR